jgi:hypothetical protein
VGADEADVVLLLEEQLQRPRRYPSTGARTGRCRTKMRFYLELRVEWSHFFVD